jgi:hypothetical protein
VEACLVFHEVIDTGSKLETGKPVAKQISVV